MSDKQTTVDVAEWPAFEKECLEVMEALNTVLPLMREVMASDDSTDARKGQLMGKLVDQYLPA